MGWQPASRRNSSHWAPGILSIQVSLSQQKICKCWKCIKMYAGIQTREQLNSHTVLFTTEITNTIQKLQIRKAYTVFTTTELCRSFSISLEGLSSFCLMEFEVFVPAPPYHSVQLFGAMITLWLFCSIIHHIKFKQHRVKSSSSSASCEKSAFFLTKWA